MPQLAKLPLRFHRVMTFEGGITMDPLENGAIVHADENFSASPDAILLLGGKATPLDNPFPDTQGITADLFEGAFPEPLLLTTGKNTKVGSNTLHRREQVLWQREGSWAPLPGGLARETYFFLAPSRLGKRQMLVLGEKQADEVREFPSGTPSGLRLKQTIEGARTGVEGVAVIGPALLVVTRVHFRIDRKGFPGPALGAIVVQRFEGDAKEPVLDWMPEPAKYALGYDAFAASGSYLFIALHDYGYGRYLAIYDGESWKLERLPFEEKASELSSFHAAPDGTLFFYPLETGKKWSVVRRDPKGRYARIDPPPRAVFCELYAESVTAAWLTCMDEDKPDESLYFTKPVAKRPELRNTTKAAADP